MVSHNTIISKGKSGIFALIIERPRKFQARGLNRLDAVTNAAAELFLESGYEALSIDAVIERAGGSRRTIYEHFGNKQGLFVEAITRRCHQLGAPLRNLTIAGEASDTREALQLFGNSLIDIVLAPETITFHRLMIAEGGRFPDLAQRMWRAGHDSAAQVLAPWIEKRQELGDLRTGINAYVLAQQFINMVVADAQLRLLIGASEVDANERKRLVAASVETLLCGCAAQKTDAKSAKHQRQ